MKISGGGKRPPFDNPFFRCYTFSKLKGTVFNESKKQWGWQNVSFASSLYFRESNGLGETKVAGPVAFIGPRNARKEAARRALDFAKIPAGHR
jgi:hypothetical protein